jgi:hypothetical protein
MSLINDALKKAARQRAEEQGEIMPPMPGGGRRRVSRQGEPMRTQTLVLVGAAALALIVISVVVTGMFMNGKPEPKLVAAAKPAVEASMPTPAPKAIVQAPVIAVSIPQQSVPTAAPSPVAVAKPTPTPSPVAVVQAPVAATAAISAPAETQSPNDAVQALVDGFHISGVRTAGAGSKALIDGHVYKLNDFVDKALGLRLSKVDEDHLTFVDREGNVFLRSF